MFKKVIVSFSVALVAACGSVDSTSEYNAQQTAEAARKLPLKKRYQLYQEVYDRQRPPDVSLAGEVAALGHPAFELAFDKLKGGRTSEILAAIEIIGLSADNAPESCSPSNLEDAVSNIKKQFHRDETAKIVTLRLHRACRQGTYLENSY